MRGREPNPDRKLRPQMQATSAREAPFSAWPPCLGPGFVKCMRRALAAPGDVSGDRQLASRRLVLLVVRCGTG
jgi:hypothetical protein